MIKLCDREVLLKEKEQKLFAIEQKKAEDLKRQVELENAKVIDLIKNF